MRQRWLYAGLAAVSLAVMSLSSVDVAAQAPKGVPKPGIKPPKLDLSQLKVFRYDPALAPPQAVQLGEKKSDVPPSGLLELAEPERAALRGRLAALLGVEAAALPVFKRAPHLNAPGDTLVLDLSTPPGSGRSVEIREPLGLRLDDNSGGLVSLIGNANPRSFGNPGIAFSTGAQPGRTYLYTCVLYTNVPTLHVEVTESSARSSRSISFTAPVLQGGKLMVPYETGPDTNALRFGFFVDAAHDGRTVSLTHCEMTLLR